MNNLPKPFLVAFAVAFGISFLLSLFGGFDTTTALVGAVAGVITFIVMNNLSGNRNVAGADAATRTRALAFETVADKTAVYLVRTGFVGMAAGMNISIDGKPVAQLKSPRFTRVDVAPGAHTVTAAFGGGLAGQTKPVDFALNGAAGEIVVLKLSMGMGAMKNPVQIERLSVESVRNELAGMQMAAADVSTI